MAKAIIRTLVGIGALVGVSISGATDVQAHHSPPLYPPIDPARVECASFRSGNHPGAQKQCYDTAEELYQLFELLLSQLAAGDVAEAIQETLPTTPQMFPDGSVVYGFAGFASIAADWVGSNDYEFVSISNSFRYRPLDTSTVVAYGLVEFTIIDHEHGETRTITSAQTELFRRNQQMPRGWEQISEQLAYVTPLIGD